MGVLDSPRMFLVTKPSVTRLDFRSLLSSQLSQAVLLGVLSGALLDLPFPLAGPLPPWRAVVSFFALVPLLYAILRAKAGNVAPLLMA